jgi:hypothetical protein
MGFNRRKLEAEQKAKADAAAALRQLAIFDAIRRASSV